MNTKYSRHFLFLSFVALLWSCAYYNTMFNALEYYKNGTEKLEKSKNNQITSDIQKDFNAAIDKCWKLINIHSDSNAYADDALLLIGKSHYQIQEYFKAERFLRQFVSRYTKSELLSEAQLWLARSLIELKREEEAIEVLSTILDESLDREIRSLALFSMGDLYRNQQNFDLAATYFNQCVEQTDDDKLAARALVALGDLYYDQEDFVGAIEAYSRVKTYDSPILIEFQAVRNKVTAQIQLLKYEEAIRTLRTAAGESRFIEFLPQMESRIGDIYILQNEIEAAERQYIFVLDKYPRTDGAASAAFGLAKLTESFKSDPDSARNLYLRVGKESRTSEYLQEAADRASLLQSYLKIIERMNKDLDDLAALTNVDSLLEEPDYPPDSTVTEQKAETTTNIFSKRTEAEIKKSLENNRFNLAEYYLLNIHKYDSARVAYSQFIVADADSVLKIKAYYALYYLNKFHLMNESAADSIKNVILNDYPESEFAVYFNSQNRQEIASQDTLNPFKQKYLNAESLLFNNEFVRALQLFNQIAVQDSGSKWAEKSRYAVAWIYENKLNDTGKAVKAYTDIITEYPQTEFAKIARNKIKEPPPEPDSVSVTQDSSSIQQSDKMVEPPGEIRQRVKSQDESAVNQDSIQAPEIKRKADNLPE